MKMIVLTVGTDWGLFCIKSRPISALSLMMSSLMAFVMATLCSVQGTICQRHAHFSSDWHLEQEILAVPFISALVNAY